MRYEKKMEKIFSSLRRDLRVLKNLLIIKLNIFKNLESFCTWSINAYDALGLANVSSRLSDTSNVTFAYEWSSEDLTILICQLNFAQCDLLHLLYGIVIIIREGFLEFSYRMPLASREMNLADEIASKT